MNEPRSKPGLRRERKPNNSELEFPGFAHEVMAKTLLGLRLDGLEATFDVNCPSRQQAGVCPQRHFFIAFGPCKGNAFITQLSTQAQPPRLVREDQHAELRRGF